MTTLHLVNTGLQTIPSTGIMVFLTAGKPLCGNLNRWPKSMGGGTYMHWFRGNAAGSRPFIFADMEKAQEAVAKIGAIHARFFTGNN